MEKCQNWLFYDLSLIPTGGSGVKFDLLSRLSTYGFLLPANTFYGLNQSFFIGSTQNLITSRF